MKCVYVYEVERHGRLVELATREDDVRLAVTETDLKRNYVTLLNASLDHDVSWERDGCLPLTSMMIFFKEKKITR